MSLEAPQKKVALIGNTGNIANVYGEAGRERLGKLAELGDVVDAETEFIFSTWGMPVCDAGFLDKVPNLKAIFYAAGTIKGWVTDEVWKRGIRVFTAVDANAVPVAEFALAATIFGLKRAVPSSRQTCREEKWVKSKDVAGAYGSVVGVIGLSRTGRHYCKLLRNLDVRLIGYDPTMSDEAGRKHVDEMMDLARIFREADVVALHAPWIKETVGMVTGDMLASMKNGAIFINTSRGALVREEEMIEVLKKRPDLFAYIDVTHPEPPVGGSPLYTLPNVFLTPHIAGSIGLEQRRMAVHMIDDFEKLLKGEEPLYEIRVESLRFAA